MFLFFFLAKLIHNIYSGRSNLTISNIAGFEPNYRCRVAHCDNSSRSYFTEDTGRLPSWLSNSSIPLSQRCVVPTIR